MPTITSISPQKNQKRVNVFLDGKFAFGIDLTNFVLLGLKTNQELTEEKVKEIIKKAEFQKTLDYLLKFATLRPRSEQEIRSWLARKKVHESLYEELFNRLRRLELLDDEKFAKWWIEQRLRFKSKSKRELEQELRFKGIKKEVINEVLGGSEVDEEKAIRSLLEKNMYKFAKYDKKLARQKMTQFLVRKGFGWSVISKVVKASSPEGCDPYLLF